MDTGIMLGFVGLTDTCLGGNWAIIIGVFHEDGDVDRDTPALKHH